MEHCPLCLSHEVRFFFEDHIREYFRCSTCYLIIADPEKSIQNPSPELKRTKYQENKMYRKLGYEKYFSVLYEPLAARIAAGSIGLELGCGDDSMISKNLRERGHFVKYYDEDFYSQKALLSDTYDFVTLFHQLETFQKPHQQIDLMYSLVAKNGIIAIICNPLGDLTTFLTWRFKRESHHHCFYHDETFKWIAKKYHLNYESLENGLIFFTKNG